MTTHLPDASSWYHDLKPGWRYSRLKYEVRYMNSGGTPKTDDDSFWTRDGSGIPWVSISDMSTVDVVKGTERQLTSAGLASKKLQIFKSGTLLYSMYASVGKVSVLGIDAAINQAILAIEPNTTKCSHRFLRWALVYVTKRILEATSNSTQDNLNLQKVRDAFIVLPDIARQDAIALFLDRETAEADALVAEYERLIALLEEKRSTIITDAVTRGLDARTKMKDSGVEWIGMVPDHWTLTPLKHTVSKLTVGIVVTPAAYYVDDGVPCLRSLNIKERAIVTDDLVYISAESNEILRKSKIYTGDIVIVRTGQTGTAAVVDERFNGGNCVDLIIVRPAESSNSQFLAYYLNSGASKAQYEQHSGGAIQQHFNIGIAGSLSVALPPREEQAEIVRHLDLACAEIDRTIEIAKAALRLTSERRAALITAAVTGKIDVSSYRANSRLEFA